MAAEKVTVMVLKVDLQCPSCYRKTKRTLCKFPQVRDQIYDEKGNTVTITVVCCSPERIRDKLCCSGGKAIKSIEIKDHAAKPKQADKPKEPEKPKQADKPKEAEKPKEQDKPKATEKKVTIVEPNPAPAAAAKPKEAAAKPKDMEKPKPENNNKPKPNGQAPPAEKPAEKPKEAQPAKPAAGPGPGPVMIPLPAQQMKGPEPMAHGVPSVFPYVGPSYDPYYHGYGYPAPPPQPCYEGYYGHGQAQGYNGYGYGNSGYGRIANVNRNDHYFTEEEPQTCSIM